MVAENKKTGNISPIDLENEIVRVRCTVCEEELLEEISSKIDSMVSTGGWEEDPDITEMAQSIAPAPARTASTYVAVAMPLVAWL